MKEIRVEDAVGMMIVHDMTRIIPGVSKEPAFRKGHIVEEKDIEVLLDMGKRKIFVWDLGDEYLHEEEAAKRMVKAAAGKNTACSKAKEGKISIMADEFGVVKINKEALFELNSEEKVCFATIHSNKIVRKGELLGATRVIPLAVEKEIVEKFEDICEKNGKIIEVKPIIPTKTAHVITGSEVLNGRIVDKFGPVLTKKAKEFNMSVIGSEFVGDEKERIQKSILKFIDEGAEFVQVSSGMSVDPDDMTPGAIRAIADEVITYGTPILPGAMFMLAYVKGIPVIGIPGCTMFMKRTVYDLIVPRILTGEKLTRRDFVELGYGGQCQFCDVCTFPKCGFGN